MAGTRKSPGTPSSSSSRRTNSFGRNKSMLLHWRGWRQVQGESQNSLQNNTPWSLCRADFKPSTQLRRATHSLPRHHPRGHEGRQERKGSERNGRSCKPSDRGRSHQKQRGSRRASQNKSVLAGTTGQAHVAHCHLGNSVHPLEGGYIAVPSATAQVIQAAPVRKRRKTGEPRCRR